MSPLQPHKLQKTRQFQRALLASSILAGTSLLPGTMAFGASPIPGTVIQNQATGSFVDTSDSTTKLIESNIVQVTVTEVAALSVVASGLSGTPSPGSIVYFDFTVTNTGNDPTQFTIPDTATLVGGSLSGIQIISYDPDGAGATAAVPVNTTVPSGGIDTGAAGAIGLPGGAILPGGTVLVRVGVTVSGTVASTVSANLTVTTKDNPDSTGSNNVPATEASGVPTGGEKTANATNSTLIIAAPVTVSGTVFHDQDTDLTINGTDAGTNAGSSTLTIYAIDGAGKVVDKAIVAVNGTYTLASVPNNSSITLRLSIDNTVAVGATAPAAPSVPSNWYHTGENLNGTLDPAIATVGDIALTTTTVNLSNENFGIRQGTIIAADAAPTVCSVDYRTALNTGITAAGAQLAVGANDLNWTAEWIAGPPGTHPIPFGTPYAPPRPVGPMPAVVVGNLAPGFWVNEPSNARWISYPFRLSSNGNGDHRNADLDNNIGEDGSGNLIFGTSDTVRLKFTSKLTLPSNANTISITMPIGAAMDNQFLSIKVNGVENLSPVPTSNPQANNYGAFTNINLTQGWQAGVNTIEVVLDSGQPQAGFMLAISGTTTQVCGSDISGTVFEDPNYGGGAGRPLSTPTTSPRDGATVELYKSDGSYISSTTTSGGGKYTFSSVSSGDYFVRVVNSTVTSSRPGYVAGLLPVQTFRTDASTGTAVADLDRVGGEKPNEVDAAANSGSQTLTTLNTGTNETQSIAPVKVGSSAVTGIDFGYNFDTIVNTNSTGQGSLAQFITNSNTLKGEASLAQIGQTTGKETSIFMITDGQAHPGLRAGLTNLLTTSGANAGAAVIASPTTRYVISDNNTHLDGRTQTANIGNTNAGTVGTGGTVGVDALPLDTIPRPEVAIDFNAATVNTNGIQVSSDNVLLAGFAAYGYHSQGNVATASLLGTIYVLPAVTDSGRTTITQLLVGTSADGTDPNTALPRGHGIVTAGGVLIQNNYIAFNGDGVLFANKNGTHADLINNELTKNGPKDNSSTEASGDYVDNMETDNNTTNFTIRGNYVHDPSKPPTITVNTQGQGIQISPGSSNGVIDNNTFARNNRFGINSAGTDIAITKNIVYGTTTNPGLPLQGVGIDVFNSLRNRISQNSLYNNNALGIDLGADGVTANNGTVNAAKSNNDMDYPIITASTLASGTLTVKGFVGSNPAGSATFANATLEFFIADNDGNQNGAVIFGDGKSKPHGEGKTFLPPDGGSCTTDANSKFTCTFSTAGALGLTNANNITATATDSVGNTSEFSAVTSNAKVLLVKRITAINGLTTNPNDGTVLTNFVDDGTPANDDNNTNWPSGFLKGAINAGKVKPGDTIQYTIYFLNAELAGTNTVKICDRLTGAQTLKTGTYGTGDLKLLKGGDTTYNLTSASDSGDRAELMTTASAPSSCHLDMVTGGAADTGTLIVDVTGTGNTNQPDWVTVAGSAGQGTANAYGSITFTTTVNP